MWFWVPHLGGSPRAFIGFPSLGHPLDRAAVCSPRWVGACRGSLGAVSMSPSCSVTRAEGLPRWFVNNTLRYFLTLLQMRLPVFFPLLIAVLSSSLQHHCHGSQHWSRRYSPGRTGDHGHSVDISGAAYRRHYTDHRCGLVSVSSLLSSMHFSVLSANVYRVHLHSQCLCYKQTQ